MCRIEWKDKRRISVFTYTSTTLKPLQYDLSSAETWPAKNTHMHRERERERERDDCLSVYSFIAYGSSKNWIEHYKSIGLYIDNHVISITS